MKRMKILLSLIVLTFAVSYCQEKPDNTFTKPVYFTEPIYINGGFWLGGVFYSTIPTGTGGVADWNTMINKPLTFPPTTHDHNSLYKPVGYVPTWAEITGKPSLFDGTWTSLTGKPTTYPSDWATTANKPPEINLDVAISQLDVIVIPKKTTAEINAMTPTAGSFVYDVTLNVLKIGNGTVFKVLITAN